MQFTRREFVGAATAALKAQVPRPTSSRPNILFLMADEHRYNALGCAGNTAVQTPNLDKLAGDAVTFRKTYCQAPLCQPSRASIITGRYAHQHGITWNQIDMNPEWPTMMKSLQHAGYYTALIGKAHFSGGARKGADFTRSFGFDHLLEEFDRVVHAQPGIKTPYLDFLRDKNLLDAYVAQTPGHFKDVDPRTAYTRGTIAAVPQEFTQTNFLGNQAVEWIRNYNRDQPFFFWMSFIDPHPPIIDDAIWAARYAARDKDAKIMSGPVVMPDLPDNAYGRYMKEWIQSTGTADFTPELASRMARHYYGMVSLVDQKIGDILAALRERGLDKNTWIVYTSDHGEMLGDHKMVFKNVFYSGSVRVPNIVRPPQGTKPRVSDALAQSIDLTATVLDIAGADLAGSQGQSLMPLIKDPAAKGRDVVHSELAGHHNRGNFFVMAANQRYRYLYDKGNNIPCELFDLEKDPDELHNLVNEPGSTGIRSDMHKDYVVPFMNS
jgi:arylsulfatase